MRRFCRRDRNNRDVPSSSERRPNIRGGCQLAAASVDPATPLLPGASTAPGGELGRQLVAALVAGRETLSATVANPPRSMPTWRTSALPAQR